MFRFITIGMSMGNRKGALDMRQRSQQRLFSTVCGTVVETSDPKQKLGALINVFPNSRC